MTAVRLGDVVDSVGGGTPSKARDEFYGGTIPWVTPKDMKVGEIGDSQVRITEAGLAHSAARLIPTGSVLLVVRSGVLKHTLPVALTTAPVAINQDIRALLPQPSVDARYLAHLLRARAPVVLRWVRATTADNFPFPRLMDLQIPLPPLDEQRRIAWVLDSAMSLRTRQKVAIGKVGMLGDALFPGGAAGGARLALSSVLDRIESGRSPVCDARPVVNGEWGVLKLGAVSFGDYRPRENKAMLPGSDIDRRLEVAPGDVLLARKNTIDLVGASAYVRSTPAKLLLPDLIFRLVPRADADIRPIYLQAALARPRARAAMARLAGGSAGSMPNISKQRLLTVEIDAPPIAVQLEYERRMEAVHRMLSQARTHLAHLDALFVSLRHRAFTGAL